MQSNPKSSRSVQETLSDLHSIFIWGEKAAPFLQDLIEFIESLTPLIEEINTSLHESTKRFPSAQSQLDNVTKATELATNEILSLLEKSLDECNVIDRENKENDNAELELTDFKARLQSDFQQSPSASDLDNNVLHAKRLQQVDNLITKLQTSGGSRKQATASLRSGLNKILVSLQVQDITTQQIAAVIHLIQSIRSRLSELHERLNSIKEIEGPAYSLSESREEYLQSLHPESAKKGTAEIPATQYEENEPTPLESGYTFDANASYNKSASAQKQQDADNLINKLLADEMDSEDKSEAKASSNSSGIKSLFASSENKETSNEEINSLFASSSKTDISTGESKPLFTPDVKEENTTEDMDSLLTSQSDRPSNKDIDKLFGS